MDYDRVVVDWEIVPRMYHIFKIKDLWYACLPDRYFFDNIIVDGECFKPVYLLKFYDGQSGDVVYGYVGVGKYENMSLYKSRFVFVKNPMNIGQELSYVLSFKRRDALPNYIKNELWKV